MQLTVYIHIIEQDRFPFAYVSFSERAQSKAIAAYCRDNWKERGVPGDIPDDDETAIDEYFTEVGESNQEYLSRDTHILHDDILLTDPCCTVIGDSLLITQPQPN